MDCTSLSFSGHAIQRMFERKLTRDNIASAITEGEIIRNYPDDTPYPSNLLLWFKDGLPIHVVAAQNAEDRSCYVITAYVPSDKLWQPGFREKK